MSSDVPQPFAGRAECRQGKVHAGARLELCWGSSVGGDCATVTDSGVVHRPEHGSSGGLLVPRRVLSTCQLGAGVSIGLSGGLACRDTEELSRWFKLVGCA